MGKANLASTAALPTPNKNKKSCLLYVPSATPVEQTLSASCPNVPEKPITIWIREWPLFKPSEECLAELTNLSHQFSLMLKTIPKLESVLTLASCNAQQHASSNKLRLLWRLNQYYKFPTLSGPI